MKKFSLQCLLVMITMATAAAGAQALVPTFEAFKRLPEGTVRGKIVLFNHAFDKQLAAQGLGGDAYGQAVSYRGTALRIGTLRRALELADGIDEESVTAIAQVGEIVRVVGKIVARADFHVITDMAI
jgi:hypothetical protein